MTAKECLNCRLASPGTAAFCACGWDFEAQAMRVRGPERPRPLREPALAPGPPPPPAVPQLDDPVRVEPLPKRVFFMPFVPALWARAALWPFLKVATGVLLLALLLDGALALYRSGDVRGDLRSAADRYDASYPAVVVAGGTVRVEGDRVIHFVDGKSTFLVDPRETIALESITTPEYLVVRETKVIRKQGFRTQIMEVADLQPMVGDPLRIDSRSLRAFEDRWGSTLQAGVAALMWAFMLIGDLLGLAYVAAAAGLSLLLRGRTIGHGFGACFRAALATYGLVLVLQTIANVAGHTVGFCVGVWLWPALMTGLVSWAVGRAREWSDPARHF